MTTDAQAVALAEGEAVTAVLNGVPPSGWSVRTDCPDWTVRDMTAHLVAQAEGVLNPLRMIRRMRAGARRFPQLSGLDAYTRVQVADHAGEEGPALAAAFATLWPRAVAMMRRTPGLVRRISADSGVPGHGRMTLGYLYDSILPRDLLMHRIDISRAIGVPVAHGDHDGSIVDEVLRELAAAWTGPATTLTLTGPAGGSWSLGPGRPVADVAAETVDYLRTLAGRNDAPDLTLKDGDGSALAALRAARVLF